jgi:tripartite-type tricarboxylate transporter receptor subunit TctC
MKLPRRQFLHLAAGAAAVPALSRTATALDYPTRPVHLIVRWAAGGPSDISTRLIGQSLSARFGQSFIVENRTGASGNLATEFAVRARPDGYTLLQINDTNSWNTALYDNVSFDFIRDIAPVAGISRQGGIMVVNPSFPAKTVPEFIAYAKANPAKINMGSGGAGSPAHLYGTLFKIMTGIDFVHIPYRGGAPAVVALLGGQVQVFFGPPAASMEHIKAGRLRALGVTTAKRMQALPDVPPISDFVPGYEASGWEGIGAPVHTPPEIIGTLNREINAALAENGLRTRLAALGNEPFATSPTELSTFIVNFTEKWAKVIRAANIKAE